MEMGLFLRFRSKPEFLQNLVSMILGFDVFKDLYDLVFLVDQEGNAGVKKGASRTIELNNFTFGIT